MSQKDSQSESSTFSLRADTNKERADLTKRLETLALNKFSPTKTSRPTKPVRGPVAESWDDEDEATSSASSSDTETESTQLATARPPVTLGDYPSAPPPTPVSRPPTSGSSKPSTFLEIPPYAQTFNPSTNSKPAGSRNGPAEGKGDVRPAKTTATAARIIAGALGVKAPKRTDEQRQYDKAARENEVRRRQREKEELEQAKKDRESAVRAAWES